MRYTGNPFRCDDVALIASVDAPDWADRDDVMYFWVERRGCHVGEACLYEMNSTWSHARARCELFEAVDVETITLELLARFAERIAFERVVLPGGEVRALHHAPVAPAGPDAAQRAVRALNDEIGTTFELGEHLGGLHRGAWAVTDREGTKAVLKVSDDGYRFAVERALVVVAHVREAGYPAPMPMHHGPVPEGGWYYLQERAPGRPMHDGPLARREVDALLDVIDMQAGLAPPIDADWSAYVEYMALRRLHEWTLVARNTDAGVQELLDACRRRVDGIAEPCLSRSDLAVGDFGPHNVLVDERGAITAVVDLEGASRGDRVIDIAGLLLLVEPSLVHHVREAALRASSAEALAVCGVHWIVRRLVRPDAAQMAPELLARLGELT